MISDNYEVNYSDIDFVVYGEYREAEPWTNSDPGSPAQFEISGVYLKDDPHGRDLVDVLEVDTLNELEELVLEQIGTLDDDADEEDFNDEGEEG